MMSVKITSPTGDEKDTKEASKDDVLTGSEEGSHRLHDEETKEAKEDSVLSSIPSSQSNNVGLSRR